MSSRTAVPTAGLPCTSATTASIASTPLSVPLSCAAASLTAPILSVPAALIPSVLLRNSRSPCLAGSLAGTSSASSATAASPATGPFPRSATSCWTATASSCPWPPSASTSAATRPWSPHASKTSPCCSWLTGASTRWRSASTGCSRRRATRHSTPSANSTPAGFGSPRRCSPAAPTKSAACWPAPESLPSGWASRSDCGFRTSRTPSSKVSLRSSPASPTATAPTTSCATWPSRRWRQTVTPRLPCARRCVGCATSNARCCGSAVKPKDHARKSLRRHPPGRLPGGGRLAEALAEVRASLGRSLGLNKPGPAHGYLQRLAGCIDRGLAEAKSRQEQVSEQVKEIRLVAETLDAQTGTLRKRRARYEQLRRCYQSKSGEFYAHLARMLRDWSKGLFVGIKGKRGKGLPQDNLDLERWFRAPKGHERRIHGHSHAGVRIVQEGATLLLVLNAHEEHPQPFTAQELLPYRQAQEPPDQLQAIHRRKVMRKARSPKNDNSSSLS